VVALVAPILILTPWAHQADPVCFLALPAQVAVGAVVLEPQAEHREGQVVAVAPETTQEEAYQGKVFPGDNQPQLMLVEHT
jgi:hypothetical protein